MERKSVVHTSWEPGNSIGCKTNKGTDVIWFKKTRVYPKSADYQDTDARYEVKKTPYDDLRRW